MSAPNADEEEFQPILPGPGESDIFRFQDPSGQGPMFGVVDVSDQTVITIYAGDLC